MTVRRPHASGRGRPATASPTRCPPEKTRAARERSSTGRTPGAPGANKEVLLNVPDIRLDGHTYDARVLANPLEYLSFLAATRRQPGTGGPTGLEAVLLDDLELVVESRANRVYQAVAERLDGSVCSCGLFMPDGLDVVSTTGHRNLLSWRLATTAFLVGEARREPARYGVVCPSCLAAQPAGSLDEARRTATGHACPARPDPDAATDLRRHLGLARGRS